jgi:hypothetical protein
MNKYLTWICILLISFEIQAQSDQDSTRKINLAAIPVINYSNTIGASFGILASTFYKINDKDTLSPSSSTGVFGMYSTNNTYFLAGFQQLYLNEDSWRITAAAGTGNANAQYWQEIPLLGGMFIGFGAKANFAMLKIDRKIFNNFYVGINGILVDSKTTFDFPDFFPDSLKNHERNMNNIGGQLNYDKRDHQLNPYSGFNIMLKGSFYREWMGSDDNFNRYALTYNHYFTLKNERNILATRFNASIATGEVPFLGQNVVGQDDIRGYSSGKYRDNQVYALQAEYRWKFYKRLGMVGFLGVATAVEYIPEIFENELLPAAGIGFRYLMLPGERINVGIDIAKGKEDWGLYFRIGEAFGR